MEDEEIGRLKILLRLHDACRNVINQCREYCDYVNTHTFEIKPDEKLNHFQSWYTSLANLINTFFTQDEVFVYSQSERETVIEFLKQPIEIPSRLIKLYDYSNEDISLRNVLRIARNWQSHIEKVHKEEKFRILANLIDPKLLITAMNMIADTINHEIHNLSSEELQAMIAKSMLYKECIYAFQDNLKLYEPIINSGIATEGQRRVFNNALNFVPTPESLVIVDRNEMPDREK